jgi:hypothetical protein
MHRVESVKISGKILPEEPSEELHFPIITITDEDESEQTTSTMLDQNDFDIFKEFSNENIIRVKHNKTMKQLLLNKTAVKKHLLYTKILL